MVISGNDCTANGSININKNMNILNKILPISEYFLAEKISDWEVFVLKDVTVEYYTLRKKCMELYPECFVSIKPKEAYTFKMCVKRKFNLCELIFA